jgi:hypothetical protein
MNTMDLKVIPLKEDIEAVQMLYRYATIECIGRKENIIIRQINGRYIEKEEVMLYKDEVKNVVIVPKKYDFNKQSKNDKRRRIRYLQKNRKLVDRDMDIAKALINPLVSFI